jgi:hypothetical protein
MIVTVNGEIMTVGLFALPLVWWRHRIGYACAIAVGLVNVIGDFFDTSDSPSPGRPPAGRPPDA